VVQSRREASRSRITTDNYTVKQVIKAFREKLTTDNPSGGEAFNASVTDNVLEHVIAFDKKTHFIPAEGEEREVKPEHLRAYTDVDLTSRRRRESDTSS
jgi:hypothetical protein